MQAVHRRERFFLFSARKLAHQNMAVCPPWGGPVPLWRSRAAGDERRLGTNSNERYIYHPDIGKEEEKSLMIDLGKIGFPVSIPSALIKR